MEELIIHIVKGLIWINNSYSKGLVVLFGVPQASILWPLPFNIVLADLILIDSDIDIRNFGDDNVSSIC